jgi:hypothetical protein
VRLRNTPVHNVAKHLTDARIVIKTQHSRLGQCRRKFLAVALCHAPDGYNSSRAIGRLENGIDGVLLGGFNESTGVDEDDICLSTFGYERPAIRREACGEFL